MQLTSQRPQLWLILPALSSTCTGSGTAPATTTTTAASTTGPGGGGAGSPSTHPPKGPNGLVRS